MMLNVSALSCDQISSLNKSLYASFFELTVQSPENRIFVPRILSIVFQAPNPPLLKYVLETKDPDLFYFRP